MATDGNSSGVVGTDGQTPIQNPNARFQTFKIEEIYTGGPGENRYVPNVGDLVADMTLNKLTWFKCTYVDQATLIAQLEELQTLDNGNTISDEDRLLGPGPGTRADTYRAYLDTSQVPHALAVDARLFYRGSMVSYVRIFRGSDLTDQGNIISMLYDSAGNILGNRIPLELAEMPAGQNKAVWSVPVCKTMQEIPDSELVTCVAYSDQGIVVNKQQLLIENTGFIRSANLSTKYVTGISLECPFLSASDPRLINLPMNVLLQGLNLIGVVNYSDGTKLRMPVDNSKFSLFGMSNYLASVVGQEAVVTLKYQLSPGEIYYGGQNNTQQDFVTTDFRVKTTQRDGSYSVKLFGYPVWMDPVNGYTLRWFLYNADRNVVNDVTGYVQFGTNSPAFKPTQYGINQQLIVSINLKDVNPAYKDYRHVQTIDIALRAQGTERVTNWTVGFDPNQNPPFGVNNHVDLEFVNFNFYRLNISMGLTDQAEWLQRLYYDTKPLIDTSRESEPLVPTHYRIRFGTQNLEFTLDQWNVTAQVINGLDFNGTLFIEFFRRTADNDLQLAVAGVPIWQINPGP